MLNNILLHNNPSKKIYSTQLNHNDRFSLYQESISQILSQSSRKGSRKEQRRRSKKGGRKSRK